MSNNPPKQPPKGAAPRKLSTSISGLKFMQRHKEHITGIADVPTAGTRPQAGTAQGAAAATAAAGGAALRTEDEWTLEDGAVAAGSKPAHVTLEEDAQLAAARSDGGTAALLQFRAGRRSFGSFNPRLEKRLDAIGANQRAAREAEAAAARAAEQRRQQEAAHAELMREAEAAEAVEKQNSVSDREMARSFAAKYSKFVPDSMPPVAHKPVRVNDVAAASGPAAKRAKKARK